MPIRLKFIPLNTKDFLKLGTVFMNIKALLLIEKHSK